MQVTANISHNSELLSAVRGAGTVFGVVVELTLRLFDVEGFYGASLTVRDPLGSNARYICLSAICVHVCMHEKRDG